MKKRKVGFRYEGNKISLEVLECNLLERFRGLMFRKKEKANALLFDFKKPVNIPIHSFFVFFPFVAIWLDNDDKIVDLKVINSSKLLIKSKKLFNKLIEIPINSRYKQEVELLVGKRKV